MNSIDRPIIVNGTGRCGSTLFFSLLSEHPDLCWISNYTNRFKGMPGLAALSRVRDMPWLGHRLPRKWKVTPKPAEANELYTWLTDGTFTQPRLLTSADVTPAAREKYRSSVEKHLRSHGKPRFAQKHTGFPRYEFLREIFPDARFVHVIRDGRAVANSMINVSWWDGTLNSWWWGPMKEEYKQELERSVDSRTTLAAIVWKTLVDYILEASRLLADGTYKEIRYSDLVARPGEVMADVLEFLDLPDSRRFRAGMELTRIYNSDNKWKSDLSSEQQRILEHSLSDHLNRLGFT
jgi:hypothetical protein